MHSFLDYRNSPRLRGLAKAVLPDTIVRAIRASKQPVAPHLGYIGARDTTRAASAKGVSVSQYVAELWDEVGLVDANIARFEKIGVFCKKGGRVVEIGPGTGRYLERILDSARPSQYQIYEFADDWRRWLVGTYPSITACQTDGKSLRETDSESADLILAFGVFTYVPLMITLRYFLEIFRTAAPGSFVVFNIISEKSIEGPLMRNWFESGMNYPTFLSTEYVVGSFDKSGFSLIDSFTSKYGPAVSEFFIFRKRT